MQSTFLATWITGVLALVAGLFLTRLHWRSDVPPFGRHSRVLDILLHPDQYARPEAQRGIRVLVGLGILLLATGTGILVLKLVG